MLDKRSEEDFDAVPEERKVLELTRNEAIWLEDHLSLLVGGPGELFEFLNWRTLLPTYPKPATPASMELIKQIGYAFNYTHDPANNSSTCKILLTEADLILLREIAHSSAYYDNEPVGLQLKKKILNLLFAEHYQTENTFRQTIAHFDEPDGLDELNSLSHH